MCVRLLFSEMQRAVLFMFIVPNQINDRKNKEEKKLDLLARSYVIKWPKTLYFKWNQHCHRASTLMSLPCRHSTLPHYSDHCFTTQRTHANQQQRAFHTCRTYSTETTHWHQLLLAARSMCAVFFIYPPSWHNKYVNKRWESLARETIQSVCV